MDWSLACSPLCKEKLNKDLTRPHLNCTTCLDRRYHYNKVDREDYVKLQTNQRFAMINTFSPVILPKNMKWYCLVVNTNGGMLKLLVKRVFTKFFCSLAEVFANW